MAKNVDHIQHIKSNVVNEENGVLSPKLPSPSVLVEGEIAVNYAEGYETLSIKNSNSNIATFSSDNKFYTKDFIDEKLGSGFTGENSANTVTKVIEDNELVVSSSLNDLYANKLDASAYTPTDLSNYYTKSETSGASEISTALNAKTDTATTSALNDVVTAHTANTTIHVTSSDKDAWNAKVDVSDLNVYADSVKYNSTSHTIEFYHGTTAGTKVFEVDASAFIIDGMVKNVEIDDVTSGSSTVKCLVVSFNTDAGKQDINIPLSDIFDPNMYYTKEEIDDDEEVISAALNDLDDRKLDATAYTPTDLSNYYTKSETSGASQISTALNGKAAASDFSAHTANTSIHLTSGDIQTQIDDSISGKVNVSDVVSAITPSNSGSTNSVSVKVVAENEMVMASALNDLNENKLDVTAYTPVVVDQTIDSGTSASTNAVSTKAVYDALTADELVWTNAYITLSGNIDTHISDTTVHVTQGDKSKLDSITGSVGTMAYENTSSYSSATQVNTAFGNKTDTATTSALNTVVTGHTADTTIHLTSTEKEQLHTHSNKTALDSITGNVGTMAYENASSYSSATQVNTALSNKIDTSAFTYTRVAVSSNLTNVNPASSLADGCQINVIYYNNGSSDYTISVTTTYKSPDGQQITLTCPRYGYCELNVINIDGTKYARGV